MRPSALTWSRGLIFVFGIGVGLGIGVLVGHTSASSTTDGLAQLAMSLGRQYQEEKAYFVYRRGDYQATLCATMSYVSQAESGLRALDDVARKQAQRSIAIAHARLAAAANHAGRPEDSKELVALARAGFEKIGERPSDQQILEMVARLDIERDSELQHCKATTAAPSK